MKEAASGDGLASQSFWIAALATWAYRDFSGLFLSQKLPNDIPLFFVLLLRKKPTVAADILIVNEALQGATLPYSTAPIYNHITSEG